MKFFFFKSSIAIALSLVILVTLIDEIQCQPNKAKNPKGGSGGAGGGAGGTGSKKGKSGSGLRTQFHKDYRVVNWCVTGRDEIEFHQWPFSQFIPILKKNLRYQMSDPENHRYTLRINEIYSRVPWDGAIVNCDGEKDPAAGIPAPGVTFAPHEEPEKGPWCDSLKECELDANTGFCRYEYVPVPTTTTTTTPAPPTPAASPGTGPTPTPAAGGAVSPGPTSTAIPTTAKPPPIVQYALQFPPPVIYNKDDGRPEFEIKYKLQPEVQQAPFCIDGDVAGCRPQEKDATILKYLGRLFKTVHISVVAEERRRNEYGIFEEWIPQEIEGVILQANHNPEGIGLPHGEFFDGGIECLDCTDFHGNVHIVPCRKRPEFASVHPTIATFHHEMKVPKIRTGGGYEMKPAGKKSEVHVNYRWYSPACTETKRLEFTLLVVRSFDNADYDIIRLGPYETTSRGQEYVSDFIPTPIFQNFFYHKRLQGTFCHAEFSPDISLVSTDKSTFAPFEMSHSYDKCVREELNPQSRELGDVSTEILQYSCHKPSHVQCKVRPGPVGNLDFFIPEAAEGFSEEEKCPSLCSVRTTTPDPPERSDDRIFKRNLHGALLTMSNFCLMPIASFIGRFYKETWNVKSYKGTKGWFMAHIVGSVISSIMIYIGTFHSKLDTWRNDHVALGKAYIIVLAVTYFTAWGRHKVKWCNLSLEFVHGVLGYCTTLLAHITMHSAPGVSTTATTLVDTQMFIHLGFLVIMTYHVWKFDKMIGMKPRRRHFPTVEARFDSIPLPQSRFRVTMIVVLAVITFTLSFISLFIK